MNDIVIYRGIIDACCFIVGHFDKLAGLDAQAKEQVNGVLRIVCAESDLRERALIDEMFKAKESK